MTRKDYQLIARSISEMVEAYHDDMTRESASEEYRDMSADKLDACSVVAHNLCRDLSLDNPNFDPGRFLEACGVMS